MTITMSICNPAENCIYLISLFHAVQPSLRAVKLGGKLPVINGAFVAPTATILGKVHVGSSSSIWYSAVIRGNTTTFSRTGVLSVDDLYK
jgi:hypothetical protein